MLPKSHYFLILSVIACCIASISYCATVTEIDTEKNQVRIDSGKNDSLRKKDRVCFYTPEGKKVTCGIIIKLNATESLVLVGKKSIQKITKNMEAKPIAVSDTDSANEAPPPPISTLNDNIKLIFPITLFPVGTYQKLAYQMPPSTSAKVTTLWQHVGAPSMIVGGLGVEGQYALEKATVAAGIKTIKYTQFSSDSYYDSDSRNAAIVEQNASALGLWVDYNYLHVQKKFYSFILGNGLEINKSTVKLKATQTNDDNASIENPLANAQSDLTVIALRTLASIHTYVWRLGISGGINLLIPLAGTATFKGNVTSPHQSQIDGVDQNDSKPKTDLQRSLAHKKATFGLEMLFSSYYSF